MHDKDCLHRFVFEGLPIRGHLVHLDASWRALIEHRNYPPAIRDTLGEAVAASLLLAATIKFEGALSLQLQGDGPVHLMLAQCTSGLGVRGLARYREPGPDVAGASAMFGAANLTVTLENDDRTQRYQGIVPVTGERLAESLQIYFQNSEQLPTRLWLQADERGASGMLLQRLPDQDGPGVADAWNRVQLLGDTLTAAELGQLAHSEILHRLFTEDDLRLFDPAPVFFRVPLLPRKGRRHAALPGEQETRSVLLERGDVEVSCDFCNKAYVFDAVDVEQLFAPAGAIAAGLGSVH